jgi:hypothetical protein
MSGEWGPWVDHDGMGCPCRGQIAHMIFRKAGYWNPKMLRRGQAIGPSEWIGIAGPHLTDGSWDWSLGHIPIIHYRIRKPLGLTILEQVMQDLPLPVGVDE